MYPQDVPWPPLPIDEAGHCATVVPRELVVANRQQLKLQLLEAIERGARVVTLDLRETVYIDSSGFGALINVRNRMATAGGRLELEGVTGDVLSLFELTKLDTFFALAP